MTCGASTSSARFTPVATARILNCLHSPVSDERMSATDLFLTDPELVDLTGYRVSRYQVAWLTNRGWKFVTNAAGAPRVARAYFERKMVGEASSAEPPLPARHNFGALRRVK